MLQVSKKFACLALSGGMDSTSLLLHLLANNYEVTAISFLYGQKHNIEIEYAKQIVDYLKQNSLNVNHHIITLEGLENLLFSSLITAGVDVPEGHYTQDNMTATVVPNRNKIFISILQSVALSISLRESQKAIVAMGIHAGDNEVYPDCRKEFIDLDYQAYLSGNWEGENVTNYLPYLHFNKYEVLLDGLNSSTQLNLQFEEIYKRTITSYKPDSNGISDYKSASSIQRIEAFIRLNQPDPILYADESGIVSWEMVKNYVLNLSCNQSRDR